MDCIALYKCIIFFNSSSSEVNSRYSSTPHHDNFTIKHSQRYLLLITSTFCGGYLIIGICHCVRLSVYPFIIEQYISKTFSWIFFKLSPIVIVILSDAVFIVKKIPFSFYLFIFCSASVRKSDTILAPVKWEVTVVHLLPKRSL